MDGQLPPKERSFDSDPRSTGREIQSRRDTASINFVSFVNSVIRGGQKAPHRLS